MVDDLVDLDYYYPFRTVYIFIHLRVASCLMMRFPSGNPLRRFLR